MVKQGYMASILFLTSQMTSPEMDPVTDPDADVPSSGQQQGSGSPDVFVSVVGQSRQQVGTGRDREASPGPGGRSAPNTTTIYSVDLPASAPIYSKAPNLPMPPMPNSGFGV